MADPLAAVMMSLLVPSSSSSPVWSPLRSADAFETKPALDPLAPAVEVLAEEVGDAGVWEVLGEAEDGMAVLELAPLEGPADCLASGEDATLLAWVALVPEPLDPVGFLVAAPPADLAKPVDIGGELEFIKIEVLLPKQTLSLGLGSEFSRMDPPEVGVSSL